MKKFYFIAFMAMLMPVFVLAQFTISGKVINQHTGKPLPGASVSAGGKNTQTDASGNFQISNLAGGKTSFKVSFVGFRPYAETFNLTADQTLQALLVPAAILADAVIVNATRASENSAATFKNLSKEELEKNNLGQDLPYLLNQTPSVVVSSDAGAGIGYTGIRIRGSDPARVNVTINGIPYNDPESQGTFWVNLPDFASSAENIQIQRGVGTSTNGAGAFGGSLNIQTTARRDTAYAELNNAAGSFNTLKNTIMAGSGLINGKFTLDGRLSRIISDGYIDRGSSNLQSYFVSGAYYGKKNFIRANVFSGKEKTYQVWNGVPQSKLRGNNDSLLNHYYNNEGVLYHTKADSVNLWNANQRTYSQFMYHDQTDNYTQTHYQLLYNHTLSPSLSFNTALHYTHGKGYFEEYKNGASLEDSYGLNSVLYGGTYGEDVNLVRRRWLDNNFYGLTYSLNYNPSSVYNLTVGGAYNEYDGDHFGEVISAELPVTSINEQYYLGRGFKKDFNIYGRSEFQAGKARFFADLQLRYLDYSITGTDKNLVSHNKHYYHTFFNPKAGVTYLLSSSSNIYGSFAVANKEPNRDDYINAIAGFLPKSENLKNAEFGFRTAGKDFQAGINAYGMFYKDQLVLTGKINDAGEYIRLNTPNSYRAGIEIDGRMNFSKSFYWAANVAFSRNKIKDYTEFMDDYDNGGQVSKTYKNTDISFSPSFIGGNELGFRPVKNAEVALLSKYVGDQYLDNTSHEDRKLEAFFVNDLRIRYNLSYKKVKNIGFTLMLNNVLNEKYESNGYTYSYLYGKQITENFYFPQAGRNVLFGVNLKF